MADVKNLLIETLEDYFEIPVLLQGSLAPEAPYPERFFVFWNDDTAGAAFYDNAASRNDWSISLMFYSTDPVDVNTTVLDAIELLDAAGFISDGEGYDVVSDEPSHTGRGVQIKFINRKEPII